MTDALTLLDNVESEIKNWRAHLNALRENPGYGRGLQAIRSAKIVRNTINTATCDTVRAADQLLPLL